jgi:glutamate dehydrogenase
MEAIHLRGGMVARGGIRWSDRKEDYRTEVLGLMKAQRVKNAIIVPDGSKGGFILKRRPAAPDELKAEVLAQYVTFMHGLLDITENYVQGAVVHPQGVRALDGPDTYLVVAADKGTATFSDTANAVSERYGFWLGDGFASGGSAGFDHKALGITARGAWESVKRHFRQLGIDVLRDPFTAVGIGDMSGDVFGNGMLYTDTIKLVAAFDHRHVFLDPNPDPATSFAERKRLFQLPGSSWNDYDRSILSAGGTVVDRAAKSVTPHPRSGPPDPARGAGRHDPAELIRWS